LFFLVSESKRFSLGIFKKLLFSHCVGAYFQLPYRDIGGGVYISPLLKISSKQPFFIKLCFKAFQKSFPFGKQKKQKGFPGGHKRRNNMREKGKERR
jgi:hypothetical protein